MSFEVISKESVLFVSLDSCRFDTFLQAYLDGLLPQMSVIAPLHKALAPSYFTFGSHSAFWMGFTPGVVGCSDPWLNPKVGKLFRMAFAGSSGRDEEGFRLEGANIVEGFRRQGYFTVGTGSVDWFNPASETGAVLGTPFERFYFAGNTWSLADQLAWIDTQSKDAAEDQPVFCFLNVGETHVPYWHEGADWDRWPSPCFPFGGDQCSALKSAHRQRACLAWVDQQLGPLLQRFSGSTILICADHGDCWGEDGLWEHGISHPATLTVPFLLRVRGEPVYQRQAASRRSRLWSFLRSKR